MKKLLLFTLLSLTAISCISEDESVEYALPFIYTLPAQSVSLTEATLAGNVEESPLTIGSMADGVQSTIESKGFIWSEKPNVNSENGTKITLDGTFGEYNATITSLKPNTKYYYKAYASNPNESTFGQEMSFTTSGEAPCSYTKDNYLTTVYKTLSLGIDYVNLSVPSGFMDGNLQFETKTSSSIISIDITLNERDGKMPLSGSYNAVYDFDSQSIQSTNEAVVYVHDFNGSYSLPQGGRGDSNTKFYIQNDSKKVTFIFCNTKIGEYVLNGKYSYIIK
jgi:hypothetical protein